MSTSEELVEKVQSGLRAGADDSGDKASATRMKEDRTRLKKQVTTAAKRLRSCIERNSQTVDAFVLELEKAYTDFLLCHDEYASFVRVRGLHDFAVVNGQDLVAYCAQVTDDYDDAMSHYKRYDAVQRGVTQSVNRYDNGVGHVHQTYLSRPVGWSPLTSVPRAPGYERDGWPSPSTWSPAYKAQHEKSTGRYDPHQRSYEGTSTLPKSFYDPHYAGGERQPQSPWAPEDRSSKSDIRLSKFSLPKFSGLRREWAEFKTVWNDLAQHTNVGHIALAYELKKSVSGKASELVRNVLVTQGDAYKEMWIRLCEYYDDVTSNVEAILTDLNRNLKPLKENDFAGIVSLVDQVESSYVQLKQLSQTECLTVREVDKISENLPTALRMDWLRAVYRLDDEEKLHPLDSFITFLKQERAAVRRLADVPKKSQAHQTQSSTATPKPKESPDCLVKNHKGHKTADCREFAKMSLEQRFDVLKEHRACFKCLGMLGQHRRIKCPSTQKCQTCSKDNHHTLVCRSAAESPREPPDDGQKPDDVPRQKVSAKAAESAVKGTTVKVESAGCEGQVLALYAIYQTPVVMNGRSKQATVFCDSGSNASYITEQAAQRLKAQTLNQCVLEVTTMGNVETTYNSRLYELTLLTTMGSPVIIRAYSLETITGPVCRLDEDKLAELFPEIKPSQLQRKSDTVDILLGADYFNLHPKHELYAVGNLSVMTGDLGLCVQGRHADICGADDFNVDLVKSDGHHAAATETRITRFIDGEELATEIVPRCGGCKCSKCPITGHSYSFREEQELSMIRNNLRYSDENSCWITSYPWLVSPANLPNNYHVTLATLRSTEATLRKDKEWAKVYQGQIEDMLERGVARQLSEEELKQWDGPTYYISHLAVVNPKSKSTPVRIVFNSSQPCKGMSLNSALAKGPDCYQNNLVGLLLRWRENEIAVVGDIRKMFHSVWMEHLEQQCHRFLWRNLKVDQKPNVYMMTRVNMGDRPAPAICTEALYKTADKFRDGHEEAAKVLTNSSYVDDLIDSVPDVSTAENLICKVEDLLNKGGFHVKCWQLSGEDQVRVSGKAVATLGSSELKGSETATRVLGVAWNPEQDNILYEVSLNFSRKRKGVRTGENLMAVDVPTGIPETLTRRMVLEQVMAVYDPLGFMCPFTLKAKVLLRETWALKLDWDDPLPSRMHLDWTRFFKSMFEMETVEYPRTLRPTDADGSPWLIILSDGSEIAYGFAAYVRWKLKSGQYWCRLIMAKSRIAPLNRISIPQMELNGAVLSKRGRKIIEDEMRLTFEEVIHLVDSETVLNMLNKVSTRFRVYEGQAQWDMSHWAWISGKQNITDWLTRGRDPGQLGTDSEWWNGPPVLYTPRDQWGMKFGLQRDEALAGEKKTTASAMTQSDVTPCLSSIIDYSRYSDVRQIRRIVAMLIGAFRRKSFKGADQVSPTLLDDAQRLLLRDAQCDERKELMKKKGKYASLKPVRNELDGLWKIGSRLKRYNLLTPENEAQVLIPSKHAVTRLLMREAHESCGHRGRDATLARFRQRYWAPHGSKLAWTAKSSCQLWKLMEPKFLNQEMGLLPEARLKPAPAFTNVMVDLFGPYVIRGEVNKRSSGKAYGVIFTDMTMRAVHIEGVFGYSTDHLLLALQRFASIRGWPQKIYSDQGSQLVGVERELREAWTNMDKSKLNKIGAESGMCWVFGPADSPWHQGAVESLVKAAKRSIHFAIQNRRLAATEFLTLCHEAANILNERPIGTIPSPDSDVSILTPNCLLIGRALTSNPGGWSLQESPLKERYCLVQNVMDQFWRKWTELCAPALVVQRKWRTACRNLRPGDVVVVADKNTLRGDYRLGLVKEVFPGSDNRVRKVTLSYKNFKVGERVCEYKGVKDTVITRGVQRLALLVPVSED